MLRARPRRRYAGRLPAEGNPCHSNPRRKGTDPRRGQGMRNFARRIETGFEGFGRLVARRRLTTLGLTLLADFTIAPALLAVVARFEKRS